MTFQLPAHLQGLTFGETDNRFTGGIGASMPPTISRQGNLFTLVDAAGNRRPPVATLDVIVLDANPGPSKIYYENGWDPSNNGPPDCWSDNGIGPSMNAGKPQNDLCATCPNNAWGSAVSNQSGKGIKACRDHKKLAVMVCQTQSNAQGQVIGLQADPSKIIYMLTVPPASLKPWREYAATLGGHGYNPLMVVTRLGWNTQEGAGILTFKPVAQLDEATAKVVVEQLQDKAKLDFVTGRLDRPKEGLPPRQAPAAISSPGVIRGFEAPVQTVQPPQGSTVQPAQPAPPAQPAGPTMAELQAQVEALKAQLPKPPKPRGRPPKETTVGPGPIQGEIFPPAQAQPAPFLHAEGPPAGTPAFLQPKSPMGNGHGIVDAPPAGEAIGAMLDQVMGLPT